MRNCFHLHSIVFSVTCLFTFSSANAQIDTDGPSETEAPYTMSRLMFQAENDFSFESDGSHNLEHVPETLLRFGLFTNLELRSEISLSTRDTSAIGFEPFRLGLKYHLMDSKGLLPEISAMGMLMIPWISDGRYHETFYEPEWRILLKNELSDKIDLGYNLGMLWQSENRQPEYNYAISCDAELSDKIKVYAEEYCFAPVNHHTRHTADVGVLYLINQDLQIDVAGGKGISHASEDYFLKAGIAFRIR